MWWWLGNGKGGGGVIALVSARPFDGPLNSSYPVSFIRRWLSTIGDLEYLSRSGRLAKKSSGTFVESCENDGDHGG